MRRCRIVTWILILSIVNFALGAPTAVRKGLEMSVDLDVVEGGTATSQKRWDPPDAWSTTDPVDRPPTPPSPDFHRVVKIKEQNFDPSYIPNWPESVGSNPGSPTGSHSGPTSGSEFSMPPQPHAEPSYAWSDGHFPSRPGWSESVNSGVSLSTGHQLTPQSLAGGSPLPPLPLQGPPEDRLPPSRPGWSVNPGNVWSSTGHQLIPQNLAGGSRLPPLPHPESAEDQSTLTNMAGWSENPGSVLSTGHDVVTRPAPSRRPLPDEIWHELMRTRLKRRISDSGTVHSEQRDSRSKNIFA